MPLIFRKELILAVLAGTIVIMGLSFIIPLFPIYITEKGASNFELGLIVSGFTISQFLVQPFEGSAGIVDPSGSAGAGRGPEKIPRLSISFSFAASTRMR